MKERVKNAVSHKFEIAGKAVPTLAVAILLLVGAGSAAVLQSYGSVQGTANVDQAVLVDQSTGNVQMSFNDSTINAGKTVRENHMVHNTAESPAEIKFRTACWFNDNGDTWTTQRDIDWSDTCKGIDTKIVEYFDQAGHDFSEYQPPSFSEADVVVDGESDGDSEKKKIQRAIQDASAGDLIVVRRNTYDEDVVIDKKVTLAGGKKLGKAPVIDGRVDIQADGVTVKGFRIRNPTSTGETEAFFVGDASGYSDSAEETIRIESNVIESFTPSDSNTAEAIHAKNYDNGDQINGLVISNNHIKGVSQPDAGAVGVKLQADLKDVEVSNNTIENVDGYWAFGITSTASGGSTGVPKDVEIRHNQIESVTADFEGVAVQVGSASGKPASQNVADPSELTVRENNLRTTLEFENKNLNNALDGRNNHYGKDGVRIREGMGDVWTQYKVKDDLTLEPGEQDWFTIVNDFAINLMPGDYRIETRVNPVTS